MKDTTDLHHGTDRRAFLRRLGLGAVAGGLAGAGGLLVPEGARALDGGAVSEGRVERVAAGLKSRHGGVVSRVAADPADIPGPIGRRGPKHHEVVLEAKEVTSEIEPGVTFDYMTFNGQVPGPMIRVRQGDTVHFTLKNMPDSGMAHNVDLHAVYGTGGGNVATTAMPGQAADMTFKAMYPGAFIYHCAAPNMDWHISSGMFGMIVVEPPEGLPEVDHEFYVGQHEVYTKQPAGTKGHLDFDFDAMAAENPTYVLLNGQKTALTEARFGAIKVKEGETARLFFVCGGPNLSSHFHPIGNIWKKAWRDGALASEPQRYVQTMLVPPGSCGVFEMDFPVPGKVKLVDHALSRVIHKGMLGIIQVDGPEQLALFNPNPASGEAR
jgi:nitrite reductase (NO-forming)